MSIQKMKIPFSEHMKTISHGTLILCKMFDRIGQIKDLEKQKEQMDNVEILLEINNVAQNMLSNVLYLQSKTLSMQSDILTLQKEINRLKRELKFFTHEEV
jgi:hypothetical protein